MASPQSEPADVSESSVESHEKPVTAASPRRMASTSPRRTSNVPTSGPQATKGPGVYALAPRQGPMPLQNRKQRLALGRRWMLGQDDGWKAEAYIRSICGLTRGEAVVIQGAFRLEQSETLDWMQVDLSEWRDLVPYMFELRIHHI
ncbi:hypothetical protein FB107DRAFT_274987 [Schizophyllum commune]